MNDAYTFLLMLASFIAGVAYACYKFKTKQWSYDDDNQDNID